MCAPDGDWNPLRVFVPLSPCFAVRVRGRFFLHSCLDKERLGQPCGCVCSTAEEEEGAIGGVRVRRGRERRREEGGARAGPCMRVSERVWRGEKKKKKEATANWLLSALGTGSRAATFHVDVISDSDQPPPQGFCLPRTSAFICFLRGFMIFAAR